MVLRPSILAQATSVSSSSVFFSLSIDYEDFAVTHQVYVSSDGEVWDAMLNQTNIGKNANKCVIKMYPFFLT